MNSDSPISRNARDPRRTVLLVGEGPTAATALDALVEQFTVVGLVRKCDAGALDCDPVVERARRVGAAVFPIATLAAVEAAVHELRPSCVVVSSFHRLLPDALLARCPFVNVHYALLPGYRGRANVNWAIINGEKQAGITVHRMAAGLDAGNILFQGWVPIGERDTVTDLYARLNALQRRELANAVCRLLDGEPGEPQDERRATYGCTRTPDDGLIDWAGPTSAAHNLVRALTPPYPGAFTYFEGKRLTVWEAEPAADAARYVGRIPGRVVRVSKADGSVDVLTGDGVLRLREVQLEGDPAMRAAQVIRSVKATLGLRTPDLLRRIEQLERQLLDVSSQVRRLAPRIDEPAAIGG